MSAKTLSTLASTFAVTWIAAIVLSVDVTSLREVMTWLLPVALVWCGVAETVGVGKTLAVIGLFLLDQAPTLIVGMAIAAWLLS